MLEELAARLGCSVETAALFQRKPRAKKGAALEEPRGASARIAAISGRETVRADVAPIDVPRLAPELLPPATADLREELVSLTARVGELEREKARLSADRDHWMNLWQAADNAREALAEEARRDMRAGSHAWLTNKREARRLRWARWGGVRMRRLRQDLRLAHVRLTRLQGARPGSKLALIGGREQLRRRLEELPRPVNPYATGGNFE